MIINGIEVHVPTHQTVKKHLRLQGRNYHWLANQMDYSYGYIFFLLNGQKPLLEKHIKILSELLEIPLHPKKSSANKQVVVGSL
jgi:hypothetical protein